MYCSNTESLGEIRTYKLCHSAAHRPEDIINATGSASERNFFPIASSRYLGAWCGYEVPGMIFIVRF
jgi:hypothetical protein